MRSTVSSSRPIAGERRAPRLGANDIVSRLRRTDRCAPNDRSIHAVSLRRVNATNPQIDRERRPATDERRKFANVRSMARQVVQLSLTAIRTASDVLLGKRIRTHQCRHLLCSPTRAAACSLARIFAPARTHRCDARCTRGPSSRIASCDVQHSPMRNARRARRAMERIEAQRTDAPSCSVHRTRTREVSTIARAQQSRVRDVAHTHRAACRVLCRCHDDR